MEVFPVTDPSEAKRLLISYISHAMAGNAAEAKIDADAIIAALIAKGPIADAYIDGFLKGKAAALTAPPGVPEGWKLVPEKPTPEMMLAADETGVTVYEDGKDPIALYDIEEVWPAMLAAATPAPGT
jgi:hypothetical protein